MVNIPALGAGFTGIGFRNIDHGYIFLLRLELQKLFEPIVCPSEHRPSRLTTDFPLGFGYHVGRLESRQKDQPVVIRQKRHNLAMALVHQVPDFLSQSKSGHSHPTSAFGIYLSVANQ